MSATNLWEVEAEVYAGPNRTVLAAMKSIKLLIQKIKDVANELENAALGAIQESEFVNGSETHLAIAAAEMGWRSFEDHYNSIIDLLNTTNGDTAFVDWTTQNPDPPAGPAGFGRLRCSTIYDLDLYLGQVDALCDNITELCTKSTSDTGAQLGEAARDLAMLAWQQILFKLGIHWPAVIGSSWPINGAFVYQVDVEADVPDSIHIAAKSDNGGNGDQYVLAGWNDFQYCSWPADGSWWTPDALGGGDKWVIELADYAGTGDIYAAIFERRFLLSPVGGTFDGSNPPKSLWIYFHAEDHADLGGDADGLEVPLDYDSSAWPHQIPLSKFIMRRVYLGVAIT